MRKRGYLCRFMRQFLGLLFSLLYASAQIGPREQENGAAPTLVDRSFFYDDTNVTWVRDIEMLPDGRIAYGGRGSQWRVGIARENGETRAMDYGGRLLTEVKSISVDPREFVVYGAGLAEHPEGNGPYDTPVVRVTDGEDDFSWAFQYGVTGTASGIFPTGGGKALVTGRLRIRGETNQFYGLVRLSPTGSRDESFKLDGSAGLEVTKAELLHDGRIVGEYRYTDELGEVHYDLGRWEANGERDRNYAISLASDREARLTAIQKAPGRNGVVVAIEGTTDGATNRTTRLMLLDAAGNAQTEPPALEAVVIEGTVHAIAFEKVTPESAVNGGFDRILIGGAFTKVGGIACKNLAAINREGEVEWCFGLDEGPDAAVEAIEVQLDGRVLIGGAFTKVSGVAANGMARLMGSSASGASFLYWADSEFRGLEKEGSAELVLRRAGDTNATLAVEIAVTHVDGAVNDGSRELADLRVTEHVEFAPGETAVPVGAEVTNDLLRENREAFSLRATVTNANVLVTRGQAELVILDDETPGTLSPDQLLKPNTWITAVALQPDGKILVARYMSLFRLNANGTLDETFTTNGISTENGQWVDPWEIRQIEPQGDGKIYVAGRFNTISNGFGINHVARLNADGTLDRSFDPRLWHTFGPPHPSDAVKIEVLDNGNVVVWPGGSFIRRESAMQRSMHLLSDTGALITTYTGMTSWRDSAKIEHLETGEVFTYGDFGARTSVRKSRSNGAVETNFVAQLDGHLQVMEAAGDWLYLAGNLRQVNSNPVSHLARVDNETGELDTNWTARANGQVVAMHIAGEKIYISGFFSEVNGVKRSRVARLNLDGSLDETFDAGMGPTRTGWYLQTESDGSLLMGAGLSRVDRVPTPPLVRLEGDKMEGLETRVAIEIGNGVTIRYSGARLEGTSDLNDWEEVHAGGGEYEPSGDEAFRFFRAVKD